MMLLAASNAEYWDDWVDLSWKDQLYAAAPLVLPFVFLLMVGVIFGIHYYRRTHR